MDENTRFSELVDKQCSTLVGYINETSGLSSLEESIDLGNSALKLEENYFDAHFLLGQALAARYQRNGNLDDLNKARRHYEVAKRLVYQRDDIDEQRVRCRIDELILAVNDCFVGTKPLEFTIKSDLEALHRVNPTAYFYDTSTNAPMANDFDYVIDAREFSPFNSYGNIPVVGNAQLTSDSVEGVWQGLKIIKGKTDFSFFNGSGRKRIGKVEGHLFNGKVIGYVEARKKIYTPTYEYMIENHIEEETLEKIMERSKRGKSQYFFDVDVISDIHDTSGPLAHSSILVDFINKKLGRN
ncbi:hypothetical protein J4437_02965 [Candidatus Woesearchaeota archaeon]|nr:hypothetical protein [Candidatus Woesearchaeota archaeon]